MAFVQGNKTNASAVNVPSATVSFTSNQAAGNTNVVFVNFFVATGATVSDQNGAYTAGATANKGGGAGGVACFTKTAIASGPNTVTVTFTGSNEQYYEIVIAEYAGYNSVDTSVAAVSSSAGTSTNTGNLTTTHVNDILVGYLAMSGTLSPQGGFTTQVSDNAWNGIIADLVEASVGTYSFSVNSSASNQWWTALVALIPAPPAAPTVTASPPSSASGTGVTLNGSITNTGQQNSTSVGFNWGTTAGYGSTVSSSGSFGLGAFSGSISGLTPGVLYHFQVFATNPTGTGNSADFTFTAPPALSKGEVQLSTQTGTVGSLDGGGINTITNLTDVNGWTYFNSPNASGDWAGVDAGAATILTRVRVSPRPAREDLAIGGQFQCTNDATWATGVLTLFTITVRPTTGTLMNEYLIPGSAAFRYFRYLGPGGAHCNIGDLEFISNYTSSVVANAAAPVIIPWGGLYDITPIVRMQCITSDAVIHYTLDGSTPTGSSTSYTGPFVLPTNVAPTTVQAIAVSTSLGNSRVTSARFVVPGAITPSAILFDQNRGYRMWTS